MEESTMNMGSNDLTYIAKGKRTKRQRPMSPIIVSMATSSSTGNNHHHHYNQTSVSQSSSTGFTDTNTTEEEEDMANCLILLANGHHNYHNPKPITTTTSKGSGFFVYECKTCNRCFSSFQALGGHRASHKKPKNMVVVLDQDQEKKSLGLLEEDDQSSNQLVQLNNHHLQIPKIRTSSNKSKVHECSICGSEFSSGQALGGHMRKHRTTTINTTQIPSDIQVTSSESVEDDEEIKKSRKFLSLDLNLPAPEDDRDGKFNNFNTSKQSLVFSASSLVGCHY